MTSYACIIADPAWRYNDSMAHMQSTGDGVASKYKTTMTLDEICALAKIPGKMINGVRWQHKLEIMGQRVADDAHLWLWITNPMLCAGYHVAVLRAWDFTAKTMATWVKGRIRVNPLEDDDWDAELVMDSDHYAAPELVQHFAQGRYLRGTTEHCILAVRGQAPALCHNLPSAFVYPGRWPGRLHSEKPPIIHEWAERLSPGPRVELFARKRRDGWDAVGDEL